jgi:hypothetical protein
MRATEGTRMAVEHDDAKYQFWDDIEREYEADCDEYSDCDDDHDLTPEELAEENGGLDDDIPF